MLVSMDVKGRWTVAGVTEVAATVLGRPRVRPRTGRGGGGPGTIVVHSEGRLGSGDWVKVAVDGSAG